MLLFIIYPLTASFHTTLTMRTGGHFRVTGGQLWVAWPDRHGRSQHALCTSINLFLSQTSKVKILFVLSTQI